MFTAGENRSGYTKHCHWFIWLAAFGGDQPAQLRGDWQWINADVSGNARFDHALELQKGN